MISVGKTLQTTPSGTDPPGGRKCSQYFFFRVVIAYVISRVGSMGYAAERSMGFPPSLCRRTPLLRPRGPNGTMGSFAPWHKGGKSMFKVGPFFQPRCEKPLLKMLFFENESGPAFLENWGMSQPAFLEKSGQIIGVGSRVQIGSSVQCPLLDVVCRFRESVCDRFVDFVRGRCRLRPQ